MKKIYLILFIGNLLGSGLIWAQAQSLSKEQLQQSPTLLYADQIIYHDEGKSVEALGHVEIHKKGLSLTADRIVYHQLTQKTQAFGNVTLRDEQGNILFFDHADLNSDFKEAFIEHIRMILSDDAKLTAFQAQRHKENYATFDKVVYSPCLVCRADPSYQPLWQIKAGRVLWNEEKETIEYLHAFMDIKGVPVLYLPYLSHPAPNVKRKSGWLAPHFGGGGGLGLIAAAPYFWAIDESKDLTLTPTVVGSRPMLSLAYRQRFATGKIDLAGSVVYDTRAPKEHPQGSHLPYTFRGHFKADALFNLSDHWRTGLKIERTTDQTYLRKFNFLEKSSQSLLVSRGFMEGFYGRNYIHVEGYDFQGLREQDINAQTPMILPLIETNLRTKAGWDTSFLTLTNHFSAIHRRIGADVTKFSTTGGWIWPKIWKGGQKTTVETKVRADVYSFSDVQTMLNSQSPQNGTKARLVPSFTSLIEWPFIQYKHKTRMVVEPLLGLVVSPSLRDEGQFPNEDSHVIELNDINLFAQSRFAGLDRLDGGSRLNYGMNLGAYTQGYGNGSLFVGQSYGFQKPAPFLEGTGLDKQASDYVTRLKLSYRDWLYASVRALFDRSNFSSQRQELITRIGQPIARAEITYTHIPKITLDLKDKKTEQISTTLSSQITSHWSVTMGTSRELGRGGGTLSQGVGATYTDECFTLKLSIDRTYFEDRDLSPGLSFMFRLVFKNLGEVQQSKSF